MAEDTTILLELKGFGLVAFASRLALAYVLNAGVPFTCHMQMDVIGINEAQFFEDLLEFCQNAADLDNKIVIVAGLDGDFLRCVMVKIFL